MSISVHHPRADLLRYLEGKTKGEQKHELERHLAGCAECREYLSVVKGFNDSLAGLSKEEFTSDEPCVDAWTLVAYEAGKVDEETARHLRAHLVFCDQCAKEFYALRRLSQEESWRALVERLKESVINLAETYGPGALLGLVRVVAEQPALAVRGGEPPKALSKVLELQVDENTYSIELKATERGLACDIAGFRTPVKEPLSISVRSGSGEELLSTESDKFGNVHFDISISAGSPNGMYVFTFSLKNSELQFLLRVPEGEPST
jgi:Putative zinc-finger